MPKKAPTATRRFAATNGRTWEAEICMYAGEDPQAPRLMVIFRDPVRVSPDRYNLLPPGSPKSPKQAADQVTDDVLRALLLRSVPLNRTA